LVRRNHEPRFGEWSFPSGYVDAGEALEDAAIREVREETGLEVRLDALIGAFSSAGERVIFLPYAGRVVRGRIEIGRECQDVRFFDTEEVPPLAFDHDEGILRDWRRIIDR
jgi:ADP-ribose pyrophosphatase YjhB (NUDIX family)